MDFIHDLKYSARYTLSQETEMSKKIDILHSAEKLFYQEGFHRTGVAKIAEHANTTQRTLYKHFASKEALVLEIMKGRELKYWETIAELEKGHSGELSSLIPFYALRYWLSQGNNCGCFYLHALSEYQGKNAEIVQYVQDYKQRLKDDFIFRLEKDNKYQPDTAELLTLIYEGLTAYSALGLSESTWDSTIAYVLKLLNSRD